MAVELITSTEVPIETNGTTTKCKKTGERRVRFAAENSYHKAEVHDLKHEEKEDRMESQLSCLIDVDLPPLGERRHVRMEAEFLKPKGYGVLLKNCFDEKDKLAQKHINAFAQLPGNDYPRGLELYLSKQHREERDQIHSKLMRLVMRRQASLNNAGTSPDVVADKLRIVSKKLSRSSRIFARRLGIADARAVSEGDDMVQALCLIKDLNQGNAKMVLRKGSFEDLGDAENQGGSKQGVNQMMGLARMVSTRNKTACFASSTKKIDRIPVPAPMLSARTGSTCSNVIQDALDLLDFSSEEEDSLGDEIPAFNCTAAQTTRGATTA